MTTLEPLCELPAYRREHVLGRAVPGAIFVLLLYIELQRYLALVHSHASTFRLVGRGMYLLFIVLYTVLTIVRQEAVAVDRRPIPWLATMVGTFGLVASPLVFPTDGRRLWYLGHLGSSIEATLSVLAIAGAVLTISILGRSFSLTPQVHRLVASGPYRLVRHPLYFFEGLAMIGAFVASGRIDALLITSMVLGAQVVRMHYEEALLRTAFPTYDECFAGVAHFVPGVW